MTTILIDTKLQFTTDELLVLVYLTDCIFDMFWLCFAVVFTPIPAVPAVVLITGVVLLLLRLEA